MFNDIQLVDDDKIKNIQTFNIKCYSDEEFLKIKEFFKTKKKSVDFEKSLEFQKKWNEKALEERNEVIKLIKEILI